jgi:pimeloyl-ACP methyl ester carboxylesterase
MSARPVVFIHGLWIHSAAWEPWIPLYRRAGYEPVVAGWPGDAGTVEATRRDATQVAGYGLAEITEHYTKLIADLPERPIIVGHSFGGLIAQQLLARRIATHAVAIDPGPIKGVTKVPLAQIRTAIPVLRKKSNRHAAKALSARQFRYGLGNAISAGESRNLYDRFAIPGPGRPLFEVTSAKKDAESPAVTDYHVFPDRGHSLVFDSGWREVADYTVGWLAKH